MEKANRIFSVNLAAFIYMIYKQEPIFQKDALGEVYFLYPDNATVNLIIQTYRSNRVSVDLREYLAAYRYIRSRMKTAKYGVEKV